MNSARSHGTSVGSRAGSRAGSVVSSARQRKPSQDLVSSARNAVAAGAKQQDSGPTTSLEASGFWRHLQEHDWEAVKVEARRPDCKVNIKEESFGWTPGHFAASAGVAHCLKALLECKAKIDLPDNEGNTMLMLSSRANHDKAVEFLLSNRLDGSDVVAMNGFEEMAGTLLGAAADHNKADNTGMTACMWAARHGHLEVVELFLACGLNLNVADHSGLTVLDHCNTHLQMSSTISALHEVNGALVKAAQLNDLAGVAEAIDAGADLDTRDDDGWTPLMWGAVYGNLDLVQLVVRYGANPSLQDENGQVVEKLQTHHLAVGEAVECTLGANSRLLEAAQEGNWAAVVEELNIGAFINIRDDCQRTALMWAAKHCSSDGVYMLLSRNANVNDRDSFGWAAVHYAVIERSPETVSMFHYLGADMKVKTYEGDSLLHMAVRADDGVMIQLLLAAGLELEDVDINIMTPLMMAAYHGLTRAVQTLIAYGASVAAKSTEEHFSRGPLALAVVQGQEHAVAALLAPIVTPPKLSAEVDAIEEKATTTKASSTKDVKSSSKASSTKGSANNAKSAAAIAAAAGKQQQQQISAKAKAAAGGVAARRKAAPKAKVEFRGDSAIALLDEAVRLRSEQPWKAVTQPAKTIVKQADSLGNTALSLAVQLRQTSIATMLIHATSDPNAADNQGNTVLMHAVLTRQKEAVEYMLNLGARLEKQNKEGLTAVDLCEDPTIRALLDRRLALGKVPAADPTLEEEWKKREEANLRAKQSVMSAFCVRLENLPRDMPVPSLEHEIRTLMRIASAPNPSQMYIETDPITGLPRGHAYLAMPDAVAQDLGVRCDGQDVNGLLVRAYKEPNHWT
eukprot:CAMPEP_0206541928 /NCGR_PEP_ID=MMETSP0325_2-20121206/9888_1 /ASSEMBLY_ACC=CAM_ASM_000347 /TAXON_ID=2866 /ORGANISM="Crypthecodinium cohnii, Strain Seligo" /LENGTH=851 /DNA_ID=CAMNT_0054039927 /DNA_START=159 /DNA_END=2715 /DNA_ORIENTATION=+